MARTPLAHPQCRYVYANGERCERVARPGHTTCSRHYTAGRSTAQVRTKQEG